MCGLTILSVLSTQQPHCDLFRKGVHVPTNGPHCRLVHGAFADASGFRGLYDKLLGEDVTVVAPPNPLRGLGGGDGEYLKAVIDEIDGPVLLVGHSYGGSVITAAGNADNVVGLVYISGFAPDEGENLTDLQSKFPAPGIIPYIVEHKLPEGGSEFTLAPEGFHDSFCADIPADDAAFYAITHSAPRRCCAHRARADPGVAQPSGLGGATDRRPVHRPRRPPLQLRPHGRNGDRDRRSFPRCHDLPPEEVAEVVMTAARTCAVQPA
jgi:pimeloyl-ACP methyl ester carboxylesterase